MEKRTIVLDSLGLAEYFDEDILEVDADKYSVIVSEFNKLAGRIKKRLQEERPVIYPHDPVYPYDLRRLTGAIKGVCWSCRKPHDDNTTTITCKTCSQKGNIKRKKRTQRLRDEHKCTVCGNLLPPECKRPRCSICIDRANALRKKRRHKCKSQRLCTECGDISSLPNHNFCETCYFKQKARDMFGANDRWQELKNLWEKQGGICPYTKKKLARGKDASLDHKYPRKHFPELVNDIDNLEWVDRQVNSMKHDKTSKEFLEWLQSIINNYQSMIGNYNGKP